MQLIEFSTQTGAGLTLAVVACMFVLFLRESYATAVVARVCAACGVVGEGLTTAVAGS